MLASCTYQYFYLYICGNNVLIDWLIIKVRDLHVSCSADGVQAGCDQEIDKANGNKNVVDWFMYESQKNRSL